MDYPNRFRHDRLIVACALIYFLCFTTTGAEPDRLDRNNLLQYRHSDGSLRPVESAADWSERRAEIVRGMQQVMGEMPGDDRRVPLNLQIVEEFDAGSYLRRLITYQSEPDSATPAYLCIPKDVVAGQRTAPAVLCLHQTESEVGHKVVVGLGGTPGLNYAAELAERGYVTLSPSYPQLANYWPNLDELGWASGTMKAVWDNSRGLDLLASMPHVDDSRGFAAIGHSLGGHNAIFTAVLDTRISTIITSCGFDSFLDYYDGAELNWHHGRGWCQDRYMPRLADYRGRLTEIPFDFHELLAALAPRPLFVSAPLDDDNFRWQSVDRCARAARPVYELFSKDENLIVKHPSCAHSFPKEMREEAYAVIDSVLRP